jgi:hypothetical protein
MLFATLRSRELKYGSQRQFEVLLFAATRTRSTTTWTTGGPSAFQAAKEAEGAEAKLL